MPAAPGSKTILIVDDDLETRLFLCSLLEGWGHRVLTAGGGEEGLRVAFEADPDVIILDMMVTREGALQMFGELRDDEDLRRIPVIMVSDVDDGIFDLYWETRQRGRRGGTGRPEAYLSKPLEADDLRCCLDRVLNTGPDQGPAGLP